MKIVSHFHGCKIGDKIVAIDGKDVVGMKTDQVSSMLRGEPNTIVKVAVERLIDGIELFEKVRTLRVKYNAEALKGVEAQLAQLRELNVNDASYDWVSYLSSLNAEVNRVAKECDVCK